MIRKGQVIMSEDYGLGVFAHDDNPGDVVSIDIVIQDGNNRDHIRVEVFEDTISEVSKHTASEYLIDMRERDAAHIEFHADPAPSLNIHTDHHNE